MSAAFIITPGAKAHSKRIRNMPEEIRRGIRSALYFAGRDLKKTASDNIKRTKAGRVYSTKSGRSYRASQPGESPANVTGNLRRSLNFTVKGSDQLEFGYDGVEYGKFLEDGTSKIDPRPALMIAIRANERNIQVSLDRQIKRMLGKK